MSIWNEVDLRRFVKNDDLYIAPLREDGSTYGTPTRIWSVVVDGQLYVRPASGPQSSWYMAAIRQKAGRIRVDHTEHEVTFEPASEKLTDAIDAAYEHSYEDGAAVAVMIGQGPRSASVRISPR